MPITKSAKKALRVSLRKKEKNLFWKNKIKLSLRKSRKAISAKSKDASRLVAETIKTLDKAASKKVVHKNTAARKKSRLVKALNKALGKPVQFESIKIKAPKPVKKEAKPKSSPKKSSKKKVVPKTKVKKESK